MKDFIRDLLIILLLLACCITTNIAQHNYPETSPDDDLYNNFVLVHSEKSSFSLYLGEDIAYIITEVDTFTGISTYKLEYESIGYLMSSTSLPKIVSTVVRLSNVKPYTAWEASGIEDVKYKWSFIRDLYLLHIQDFINSKIKFNESTYSLSDGR